MKIIKLLFVLALVSALAFSCKSEKKEGAQDESAVEMTEESSMDESSSDASATSETSTEASSDAAAGAAASGSSADASAAPAEGVEGAAKGVEEMAVAEGVMTEDMADTPVIYPGCAGATNEEIRACSKEKFIAFLKSEFNKDLGREAGLDPGDHEIKTVVHIDEAGKCSALRVTTSNYKLEGEMKRVIAALPQMTPATEAGQPVPVTFVLPLDFKME